MPTTLNAWYFACGEILHTRISRLEPALAGELTGLILCLAEEDIARLIRNEDALLAQVQRLMGAVPESSTANNDEELEDHTAESMIQRSRQNVLSKEYKSSRGSPARSQSLSDPKMTASQGPQTIVHMKKHEIEEGLVGTAHAPVDSDSWNKALSHLYRRSHSVERFVDGFIQAARPLIMRQVRETAESSLRARIEVTEASFPEGQQYMKRSLREPVRSSEDPLAGDNTVNED